jgi:hypothetical protein
VTGAATPISPSDVVIDNTGGTDDAYSNITLTFASPIQAFLEADLCQVRSRRGSIKTDRVSWMGRFCPIGSGGALEAAAHRLVSFHLSSFHRSVLCLMKAAHVGGFREEIQDNTSIHFGGFCI